MYFVWFLISGCIGSYEGFKKQNSLINRFYSTDDCVANAGIDHYAEDDDENKWTFEPYEDKEAKLQQEVFHQLTRRSEYEYSYA